MGAYVNESGATFALPLLLIRAVSGGFVGPTRHDSRVMIGPHSTAEKYR